jgi:hypothetical protein
MVTTTTPDGIRKPTSSDTVTPLEGHFQALADDTQTGLLKRDVLAYANTSAFPAASAFPMRFAIDQSTKWLFLSDGVKWYGVVPLVNHPIDGTTLATASVDERRQKYLNLYVQSGDPGNDPGRLWAKLA